jgi:hypothetical protein
MSEAMADALFCGVFGMKRIKRMSKSITTTQRTLARARQLGFTCGIVEKWNPHAHIRQDLFGFIDILAMREGCGLIAIQTTSDSNRAGHRAKILAEPRAKLWLECGNRVELWTWGKHGDRGKRKLWQLHREEITLDAFPLAMAPSATAFAPLTPASDTPESPACELAALAGER